MIPKTATSEDPFDAWVRSKKATATQTDVVEGDPFRQYAPKKKEQSNPFARKLPIPDFQFTSESVSESTEPVTEPTTESPTGFLEKDIEQSQFFSTPDIPSFDPRSLAEPVTPSLPSAKKEVNKETILSDVNELGKYINGRFSSIDREIKALEEVRSNELDKIKINGGDYFTPDNAYEAAGRQIKEKRDYLNKLRNNAAAQVASLILPKYLENPTTFNPRELGRELVKASSPDLESKFQLVENEGKPIPGIQSADLEKMGIDLMKSYVGDYKFPPKEQIDAANASLAEMDSRLAANPTDISLKNKADVLRKRLDEVNNIQKMKQQISVYEKDFEERNYELTWSTVKDKLGAYFHAKNDSGVFGYNTEKLMQAVNDPAVGLTEGEKAVALNYGIPLESKLLGTDIPGSRFVRSFKNAVEQSVTGTWKTIASEFNKRLGLNIGRTEADQASELLNEESGGSRFRSVGDNPRAVSELFALRAKETSGQQLSDKEKSRKIELQKYVDVRTNWDKVKDLTGNLTGQVAAIAVVAKGVGWIGNVASKVGTSLGATASGLTSSAIGSVLSNEFGGLFISSYLFAKDGYDKQAIDLMPGEDQAAARDSYSSLMSGFEAATEMIFRDTKVLDGFMGKLSPNLAKVTKSYINGEITSMAARDEINSFISKYVKTAGKGFVTSIGENATEEGAIDFLQGITNAGFGIEDWDLYKTGTKAVDTFVSTAIGSGIIGSMAGHGAYRKANNQSRFMKATVADMAVNPAKYLRSVEELQAAGEISQQQANDKIKIIKSSSKFLGELPATREVPVVDNDGNEVVVSKRFDYPEATSYVLHRLNEGILTEKLDATTDPIEQAILKKQISQSEKIRKGIYEGKIGVTPNIDPVSNNPEEAQELGILNTEEVSESDLIGTPFKKEESTTEAVVSEVTVNEKEQAAINGLQGKDFSNSPVKPYTDVIQNPDASVADKKEALKGLSDQLTAKGTEITVGEALGKEADLIYDLGYEPAQESEAIREVTEGGKSTTPLLDKFKEKKRKEAQDFDEAAADKGVSVMRPSAVSTPNVVDKTATQNQRDKSGAKISVIAPSQNKSPELVSEIPPEVIEVSQIIDQELVPSGVSSRDDIRGFFKKELNEDYDEAVVDSAYDLYKKRSGEPIESKLTPQKNKTENKPAKVQASEPITTPEEAEKARSPEEEPIELTPQEKLASEKSLPSYRAKYPGATQEEYQADRVSATQKKDRIKKEKSEPDTSGGIKESVPKLTKEALDMLSKIDKGGSVPAFVTKNLEKIAADNDIEVTGKTKAQDIINSLRERANITPEKPKEEPQKKSQRRKKLTSIEDVENELRDLFAMDSLTKNNEEGEVSLINENGEIDYEQLEKTADSGTTIFERLSPTEKQGGIDGGRINVEASLITEAIHGSSQDGRQGGEKLSPEEIRNREEEALTKYAKDTGVWIEDPFSEFGETPDAFGAEQNVYLNKDGVSVTKINSGFYNENWRDFFERIALQNTLFPEAKYTVKGFTNLSGDFSVIIEQPLIQAERGATKQEIVEDLSKRGFENIPEEDGGTGNDYINKETGVIVKDLHGKNVLADDNGNLFYIDPIIELDTPDKGYGGTRQVGGGVSSSKSLDKISSISVSGKQNTIQQYLEKAKAVLSQLYPNATITTYDTAEEYYDKEGRPVGSAGVFHPQEQRLALNLELIAKHGAENTIFHEVIHPIVNEAIVSKEGALNDAWDRLMELKDVLGMEAVFDHIQAYAGRGTTIQKVEGITEFLTQVADGNIDVSNMPKSLSTKIIDLINKLFEALGINKRISTAQDLATLSQAVKDAFATADATAVATALGRRQNVSGDSFDSVNGTAKERATIEKNAKGNGTWMKAPNGERSNLSEDQWVAVRTSAFKKWFGDWENNPAEASKVVDSNGEPLVVYHGTSAKFDTFLSNKISTTGEGHGFYFTPDQSLAKGYGDNILPVFLYIRKPMALSEKTITKSEYKNIIKNADPTGDGYLSNWGDVSSDGYNTVLNEAVNNDYESSDSDVELIGGLINSGIPLSDITKISGYDGSINNVDAGIVMVALAPNQIKSATENKGTFNPQSDVIYDSLSGKEQEQKIRDIISRSEGIPQDKLKAAIKKYTGWSDEKVDSFFGEEEAPSGETGEREFGVRVAADKELEKPSRKQIKENLAYIKGVNAISAQEAESRLNDIGEDEAYDVVVNDRDIAPATRVMLGQMLIKKFNKLAVDSTDPEEKEIYHEKTVNIADFVSEKLGTIPGQMVQALTLYSRLSPEANIIKAVKEKKKDSKHKKDKAERRATNIVDKISKVNAETADEITSSKKISKAVDDAKKSVSEKAAEKIERARKRRQQIKDKYKSERGTSLYSGVGLTKEGIEYVGNIAKTYIDEGIAELSIIIDNVINDLKELTGKAPNEEVIKNVNDIVFSQFQSRKDDIISKNLKDLEATVGRIIKEHYTIKEAEKRSLVDKFVESAGLPHEEAKKLADEVSEEFDRIATRKKTAILDQEKKQFNQIKKILDTWNKTSAERLANDIIKYTNLGAFDRSDLIDMLAKKIGTGQLTPEEIKKIRELAERVEKAPEGSPKTKATEDLLAYQADLKGTSWAEVGQAIWYANVLSGVSTHLKNIISTFFNGAAYFATQSVRDPRSIPFLFKGGASGAKRGFFEAIHTATTGETPIHVRAIDVPDVLERKSFYGGIFNPFNYLKYVTRMMKAEDVLQFQALKEMRATQLAYKEARKLGYKNSFSNSTWRKVDELLLNTKERIDEATKTAQEEGLSGAKLDRRVYELMELSRPIQMTEDAYGFAAKGTFNHDTEGTLGALNDLASRMLDFSVGGAKPLRFIVPFTRILTNVLNNAIDFSPLGLIRAARGVRGFKSFGKSIEDKYHIMTPDERADTLAKASLATAITIGLYALTKMKGDDDEPYLEITGGGTGDYRKDAQLRQSGWQPYSVKIGDNYYSYALTPLAISLGLVGNINDHEKYSKGADEEDLYQKVTLAAFQWAKLATDMTWISSTASFMGAWDSDSPKTMAGNVSRQMANTSKSFLVPNIYSQTAQEYQRLFSLPQKQANNFYEQLIQDIPIARNSLNDKINALGDPIIRDTDLMISEKTTDPTLKLLMDKKVWVSPVNKNSFIVYDKEKNIERVGTDDEYYRFSKIRGRKIKEGINEAVNSGVPFSADGRVTISDNNIVQYRPLKDVTSSQFQSYIRSISGAATKAAKSELTLDKPKN